MNAVTAFSPGKVIVSGEHSAVYDQPAVAGAIDLRVHATIEKKESKSIDHCVQLFADHFHKNVHDVVPQIEATLPIGAGLGSSAAFAHAVFRGLAMYFGVEISNDEMISLIQESERFIHGHPSGLDAATVVHGGVIEFQRSGEKITYASLPVNMLKDKHFFLIDSGKPQESTKEMIEVVRQNIGTHPHLKKVIQHMGDVARTCITYFKEEKFAPELLTANQRYLEEIGVVSEQAKAIVSDVENMGGFVKVTGAGGITQGSGMLLAYHADEEKLQAFLHDKKWPFFQVKLGVFTNV